MKINPQISAYQARSVQGPQAVEKQEHQAKVLKKALDSHDEASTKLLKLLEPKGKHIDIKA
jgi:hypothetical protein